MSPVCELEVTGYYELSTRPGTQICTHTIQFSFLRTVLINTFQMSPLGDHIPSPFHSPLVPSDNFFFLYSKRGKDCTEGVIRSQKLGRITSENDFFGLAKSRIYWYITHKSLQLAITGQDILIFYFHFIKVLL